MEVLEREPYSHVLLVRDGEWFLTFLVGRAVMRDVTVRLTPAEIAAVEAGESTTADLVETFRDDRSSYEGRRVTPPIRPPADPDGGA
ncbi:hypothetical protein [Haloarchaeobius baliensis]|uniref:hypothetical protein n=1 Tax=Haloarchaeobius baliensis TaxID=1670458 RepID=UPI003F883651